jgi:hypothetical protein
MRRLILALKSGVQFWCPHTRELIKSGKFGGRRDKYAAREMTRNPIIYKVFGVFLGFIEILLEVLYGKPTFYH